MINDNELISTCHSNIGACLFELGKYEACIEESNKALSFSETLKSKLYGRIAKSYFYLHQYDEANKYIQLFLDTKQTDPGITKILNFLKSMCERESKRVKDT